MAKPSKLSTSKVTITQIVDTLNELEVHFQSNMYQPGSARTRVYQGVKVKNTQRVQGAYASNLRCGGCSWNCSSGCKHTCTSCSGTCSGGCMGSCTGSCEGGCGGGCLGGCSGGCSGCSGSNN